MRNSPFSRRELFAVAALAAAAAVLRLYRVNHFAFWVDECLTIFAGRLPLAEGIELILLRDVHPPLFYVVLHFWLLLSDNETFLRAFSVIPSVAAVPVLYRLARRTTNGRAALIAAALLAINPLHVAQAQQLRYPSMVVLLTLLSLLFFHKALHDGRKRDAALFALFSVFMMYTNYMSLGVFAFEGVWLLATWKKRLAGRSAVFWSMAGAATVFAVWLPIVLIQSARFPPSPWYSPWRIFWNTLLDFSYGPGFWGLRRAGSEDAELIVLGLLGRGWLLFASLVPFFALIAYAILRKKGERRLTFPVAYLAVVLPFGWLVCSKSGVFQAKYILPALPAFILVMADGIAALTRRWRPFAVLIALLYLPLTAYGLAAFYGEDTPYQEYYRSMAKYLLETKQPADAVLVYHKGAESCLDYYSEGTLPDVHVIPWTEPEDQIDKQAFLDQMNDLEARYERLWVIYYYEEFRDPGGFARKWFPIQFREIPAEMPATLDDVLDLYFIVYHGLRVNQDAPSAPDEGQGQ